MIYLIFIPIFMIWLLFIAFHQNMFSTDMRDTGRVKHGHVPNKITGALKSGFEETNKCTECDFIYRRVDNSIYNPCSNCGGVMKENEPMKFTFYKGWYQYVTREEWKKSQETLD